MATSHDGGSAEIYQFPPRGRFAVAPAHSVFRRRAGMVPHAQDVLEQEFQHPSGMRRSVGEILDEVDEDQGAAGAVEHRDLAHDASASHQHLVDLASPITRR